MAAPVSKSYNYAKRLGFKVESATVMVGEHAKRELFGLFNLIGIHPHRGLTLAVLSVSIPDVPTACQQVLESRWTNFALSARWMIEVHGWDKGILEPRIVRFGMIKGKPAMV